MQSSPVCSLLGLTQDVYLRLTCVLPAPALCSLDCVCRYLRALNGCLRGPWRALGLENFKGVELHHHGGFGATLSSPSPGKQRRPLVWESLRCLAGQFLQKKIAFGLLNKVTFGSSLAKSLRDTRPLREGQDEVDWKARYCLFARLLLTFRDPFNRRFISAFIRSPQIGYCHFSVPCIPSSVGSDVGEYIEFFIFTEKRENTPNVSLVGSEGSDFGLAFRPDTGTIVRKCRSRENHRRLEVSFIPALKCLRRCDIFVSCSVGIYVKSGHVAFFRRRVCPLYGGQLWETTGYSADLSLADSRYVTPAIVFRERGAYRVHIAHVGHTPPSPLGTVPGSYDESRWKRCNL